MKLYALVITYRNCDSLKKCLNRLLMQTEFIDKIVVVNNASNDATEAFLESVKDRVDVLHLRHNTGGAGGYHYGLKYCVEKGADWVWCVEDDILSSKNFAKDLKSLIAGEPNAFEKVGFLYPRVLSILNRHKMDGTVFPLQPAQQYLGLQELAKAQFAGCVLNASVIKKIGLPYWEFFIYCDDWEFTTRITRRGYHGLFLNDFFVWHNANEVRQIQPYLSRRKQDVWKHFYGIRNELYLLRKYNFMAFIKPFLMNLFYVPALILIKRKEDKWYVAGQWFLWTLKSLFLKTEIAFPDGVR